MRLRVGSGLPNIQKKDLVAFLLLLPTSIEEQTKIANFLSAIDEKINQCQVQITNTEVWKKGLLQQMFC
jgi:type I restriction enzyme S subunit